VMIIVVVIIVVGLRGSGRYGGVGHGIRGFVGSGNGARNRG
jgi:hypothetical protein